MIIYICAMTIFAILMRRSFLKNNNKNYAIWSTVLYNSIHGFFCLPIMLNIVFYSLFFNINVDNNNKLFIVIYMLIYYSLIIIPNIFCFYKHTKMKPFLYIAMCIGSIILGFLFLNLSPTAIICGIYLSIGDIPIILLISKLI